MEATSTDSTLSSNTSASAPPGYHRLPYINPTMPGYPYPVEPDMKPASENENAPPNPIDWQEVDDRMRDIEEGFNEWMRLINALGWDGFLLWLKNNLGINLGNINTDDFFLWYTNRYLDRFDQWFRENYPDASDEQRSTWYHKKDLFREKLSEIFHRHIYPSTPGNPNPWLPFGGADDDRYRPMDINDPSTWSNFDIENNPFLTPWWYKPNRIRDDPMKPYPGVYQG